MGWHADTAKFLKSYKNIFGYIKAMFGIFLEILPPLLPVTSNIKPRVIKFWAKSILLTDFN